MANTIKRSGRILTVIPDGATDFNSKTDMKRGDYSAQAAPSGIPVASILMKPGGIADNLIIREGSATGPELLNVTTSALDDEQIVYFDGTPINLFMLNSEQTFGTPANARIIINLAG